MKVDYTVLTNGREDGRYYKATAVPTGRWRTMENNNVVVLQLEMKYDSKLTTLRSKGFLKGFEKNYITEPRVDWFGETEISFYTYPEKQCNQQ